MLTIYSASYFSIGTYKKKKWKKWVREEKEKKKNRMYVALRLLSKIVLPKSISFLHLLPPHWWPNHQNNKEL